MNLLLDHLAHARLALFLGADLPQTLTGLPSRADLARRRGLDEGLSLAAVAQRMMQGGNRFEFTDYLGRQLDTLGKQPQRFHRLVVQLPAQTIVTTAYDNLLELAFQQAGEPINRQVRDSDIAFADPRRRTLIKLYGDAQQRDTLVVAEDDHFGLLRSREKEGLLDEVRTALRKNAVLFLGYNLADPDFNLLWREVLDRMGRFALGAYAAWPGLPESERRMWEQRQVHIVDAEPVAFLEQLVATADRDSVPTDQTSRPNARDKILTPAPHLGRPPLDEERRQHLEALRHDHQRRLMVLERQAAQLGVRADPHIITEIEDIQGKISEIDRELRSSTGTNS